MGKSDTVENIRRFSCDVSCRRQKKNRHPINRKKLPRKNSAPVYNNWSSFTPLLTVQTDVFGYVWSWISQINIISDIYSCCEMTCKIFHGELTRDNRNIDTDRRAEAA